MNEKKNSLISTVAAAKNLRKVPGFDPLKYLRTISRDGEKILKLDLSYKKLWFRMACPQGRMLLNPLRITDQMAIFEARVYASKDDATPLASFTSTQKAHDIPGGLYIRAAQDEALNEALDNAGFGIQLCDVAQVSDGSGYGSEIPLSQVKAAVPVETPVENTVPTEPPQVDTVPSEPAEALNQTAVAPIENEAPHQEPDTQAVTEDAALAPVIEEPVHQDEAPADSIPQKESNAAALPTAPQSEAATPVEPEAVAEHIETVEDTAASGGYTEDMSVENLIAVAVLYSFVKNLPQPFFLRFAVCRIVLQHLRFFGKQSHGKFLLIFEIVYKSILQSWIKKVLQKTELSLPIYAG